MGMDMGKIAKNFALFLTLILAVSCLTLLMVESATAQTTSKPSVPEFTVRIVASSLEVTIKNQPITAYVDTNSSNPSLYYGFRFKDHNDTFPNWNYSPIYYVGISSYGTYYKASTSDYTIVSFPAGSYPLTGIIDSGQVDLQVIALIGNEVPTNYENGTVYGFDGVESVWSSIQTIDFTLTKEPEPFPTALVATASGVSIAIIGVGLLVYFKKRKH
jgi:hypothetical protein